MVNSKLEIGKIVNTHALKGDVKIQPWCDDPEVFFDLDEVYINDNVYFIERARIHKNFVIVKFKEVNSIEEAELLKNSVVEVEREALGDLPEGVYYICDLLDSEVITVDNKFLGYIDDVIKTGSNDVYVLKGTKNKKPILIPVLPEIIVDTNIEDKIIKVKLIKGLVNEDEI